MAAPMNGDGKELALSVPTKYGQQVRNSLQTIGLYDSSRRSKSAEDGHVVLPVLDLGQNLEQKLRDAMLLENPVDWKIVQIQLPASKKNQIISPYQQIVSAIDKFLRDHGGAELMEDLRSDIPRRWERHGDLVMIDACFQNPFWRQYGDDIWRLISEVLSCDRLAQKGSIASNGYRTPSVRLLLGQDGWVEHVDNGIRYTYDVTKCMFSAGNVTEKLRVSRFHCENETVVDLYAGIGYFTLPYLVHARADRLHACEWNPDAVEALRKNLRLNGVEDRCVVHFGDNRQLCPKDVADRVNLGLIPSSEPGWETACAALKRCSGGILHIHGNVETGKTTPKSCNNCDESENVKCLNNRTENEIDSMKVSERNLTNSADTCSSNSSKCSDLSAKTQPNSTKEIWGDWSLGVSSKIRVILERLHTPHIWQTKVLHIEHVKSYAPHIDHLVVDIECRPVPG
eukprot:XP_011433560.1 PREDICTED: tRNA wybutosine-synthesizing protein 2 homolog isoform X2 [Crassostrea gigas]